MNAAQRQEALLQGALLEYKDEQIVSGKLSEIQPEFTQDALDYDIEWGDHIVLQEDGSILVTQAGATATLTFKGTGNCELYLMISGMHANAKTMLELYREEPEAMFSQEEYEKLSTLNKNLLRKDDLYDSKWSNTSGGLSMGLNIKTDSVDTTMSYLTPYHTNYVGQEDYLVNLGYEEKERSNVTITFSNIGKYSFDDLEIICQPMDNYGKQIYNLKENVLENEKIGINKVSGSVSLEQDKLLCLTIPYNKGWKAYVDGRETPLYRANEMYMGLLLEEGEHTIELCYQTYGLKAGFFLSLAGLGVLIVIGIVGGRKEGGRE